MNAVIQNPAGSFEGLVSRKQNFLSSAAASSTPRNAAWQKNSLSIQVTESQFDYKVVIPLLGIDPRKIFVFAMPQSIVIEVRLKSMTHHKLPIAAVIETIDERIVRELSLPVEIAQNATTCRISGESLLIKAPKARQSRNEFWSRLIPFDGRA